MEIGFGDDNNPQPANLQLATRHPPNRNICAICGLYRPNQGMNP
jgi:hypothetical protein